MRKFKSFLRNINPMLILLLGYIGVIFVGSLLLKLPAATKDGLSTSWMDAIFTATSSTCVTGLLPYDTYTHFTVFGQVVQLILIQIGAIGFMTMIGFLPLISGHRMGISTRVVVQNSINAPDLNGVLKMARFIILAIALTEFVGAVLLCFWYCPTYGAKGIWLAIFQSVSAFCNAGIDTMGIAGEGSSLSTFTGHYYPTLIMIVLIVTGGLGFYTWRDIFACKFHWKQLKLQSKLALSGTVSLLLFGFLAIFLFEQFGHAFDGMDLGQKALSSLFLSANCRSAGFTMISLDKLTGPTVFLMVLFTIIGGGVGSTAGGIKVETLAVLSLNIKSTIKRRKDPEVFGRRIGDDVTQLATTVLMLYIFLFSLATILVSLIEGCAVGDALFECISATTTSGFSVGLTPTLSLASRCILIVLMIFGRAGSLTMLMSFSQSTLTINTKLPSERIQVG